MIEYGPEDRPRQSRAAHALDYGGSFNQLKLMQVPELHDKGLTGANVTIAVFDSGFHTSIPCFSELKILAVYDFVKSPFELPAIFLMLNE